MQCIRHIWQSGQVLNSIRNDIDLLNLHMQKSKTGIENQLCNALIYIYSSILNILYCK
jgi:hypothetical protein